MSNNIEHIAGGAHAPQDVARLANKLAKANGCQVKITNEKSGYHIYLPCPGCLATHGRKELSDPKYAINASKYLQLGDAYSVGQRTSKSFLPNQDAPDLAKQRDERSGVCMRTVGAKERHTYALSTLLALPTITERHPDIMTRAEVVGAAGSADKEQYWLPDPDTDVPCPPPPGDVTPINELPADHPAVHYLQARGFDTDKLFQQFHVSYCTKELPPGEKYHVWYRRMPGFWNDTPQGRIIFYSMHEGTRKTWQARYIDFIAEDGLNMHALNPYSNAWDHIATRTSGNGSWIRVDPFNEVKANGALKWQPSKYKTATHSFRELMGWDAAVENASKHEITWCVLTEGPLDAARVGPGGIALIGKTINMENVAKIVKKFQIVYTAFDNDKVGKEATEKITRQLLGSTARGKKVVHVQPFPVAVDGKDLGDMTQEAFDKLFVKVQRKTKRLLGI